MFKRNITNIHLDFRKIKKHYDKIGKRKKRLFIKRVVTKNKKLQRSEDRKMTKITP